MSMRRNRRAAIESISDSEPHNVPGKVHYMQQLSEATELLVAVEVGYYQFIPESLTFLFCFFFIYILHFIFKCNLLR